MDLIVAMFSAIGTVITNFVTQLGAALTGVTALFWVEASGSETSGHLTVLGVLLIVAVGVALVYFAFNLIRSLIRRA